MYAGYAGLVMMGLPLWEMTPGLMLSKLYISLFNLPFSTAPTPLISRVSFSYSEQLSSYWFREQELNLGGVHVSSTEDIKAWDVSQLVECLSAMYKAPACAGAPR